jgi:hypothetical protein
MLDKTFDDEPLCVCVCVLRILITKDKILPFSNYKVQFLTKIRGNLRAEIITRIRSRNANHLTATFGKTDLERKRVDWSVSIG